MKIRINLTRQMKVELLSAIKSGVFTDDQCPELSREIDKIAWNYDPVAKSPLNALSLETLDKIDELIRADREQAEMRF